MYEGVLLFADLAHENLEYPLDRQEWPAPYRRTPDAPIYPGVADSPDLNSFGAGAKPDHRLCFHRPADRLYAIYPVHLDMVRR